jgi:hypothetical protein
MNREIKGSNNDLASLDLESGRISARKSLSTGESFIELKARSSATSNDLRKIDVEIEKLKSQRFDGSIKAILLPFFYTSNTPNNLNTPNPLHPLHPGTLRCGLR